MIIGLCDDQSEVLKKNREYLLKLSIRLDLDFYIYEYSSGEELLQAVKGENIRFHICILDMEMDGISGLETARQLREDCDYKGEIVFLTSYPQFMADSFDVGAGQYLVKPIDYELFEKKMQYIIKRLTENLKYLVFKLCDGQQAILGYNEIVMIQTNYDRNRKGIIEVCTETKDYIAYGSVSAVLDKMEKYHFVRIRKNAIVNLAKITRMNANSVLMVDGQEQSIGRAYKKGLKDIFMQYMCS